MGRVVGLFFAAGLTLIAGTFFRFVSRRVEIRPEDYEDAEIEDGAGELGFFSRTPGGHPDRARCLDLRRGFASGNWWLSIFAVAVILGTAAGLVFEYHVGPEKH